MSCRGRRTPWSRAGLLAILLPTLLGAAAPARGAAESPYLRLQVLVAVYPRTFTHTARPEDLAAVRAAVGQAVESFWRASRMRLHLAVDLVTVDRFVPEPEFWQPRPGRYWMNDRSDGVRHVENDLLARGCPEGDYDIVAVLYAWRNGPGHGSQYGGAAHGVNQLLGRAAYLAIPMAWNPGALAGILEHELMHAIESIFRNGTEAAFPYTHNGAFFEAVHGPGVSWLAWALGNLPDRAYFEPTGVWGRVAFFPDRDGDRIPDRSPPGDALTITEASLGSSSYVSDTDLDGVSDLDEALAGSDPLARDPERKNGVGP